MNDTTSPPALTPEQRQELKARAHHLEPVVLIGDAGLTDAVLAEADRALAVHQLIKIRVRGDDRAARADAMRRLCEALDALPVQSIGKVLVVWRPSPDGESADGRPAASARRPRGPYQPKKAVGSGGRLKPAARRKPRAAPVKSRVAEPPRRQVRAPEDESARRPGRAAAAEPARRPARGTAPDPTRRPARGTAPDPTRRPARGTAPDPTPRPARGTAPDPTRRPARGTAPDPTRRPGRAPAAEPARRPGRSAAAEPVRRSNRSATDEPARRPGRTGAADDAPRRGPTAGPRGAAAAPRSRPTGPGGSEPGPGGRPAGNGPRKRPPSDIGGFPMTDKRSSSATAGKRTAAPGRAQAATAKKPAAKKPGAGPARSRTAGKRTDITGTVELPAHRGDSTQATQGPPHLQGKPGPRTGGRRARGRS